MVTAPDLSLRGPNGAVAISGRQLRFRREYPVIRLGTARFPRRFAPRNDTSGWCSGAPVPLYSLISLHKALTTRKGHAASVRRQSRQRLRSERRYRRNWCIPFSRRPVRIGSIAPSEACPSPTTRKQLPCTTPDFRQNVFDISGAGGYNKDVETQTVATNITYLFPICELDHSQISESSGCDRRLTFFLSEANRRSGRDAR